MPRVPVRAGYRCSPLAVKASSTFASVWYVPASMLAGLVDACGYRLAALARTHTRAIRVLNHTLPPARTRTRIRIRTCTCTRTRTRTSGGDNEPSCRTRPASHRRCSLVGVSSSYRGRDVRHSNPTAVAVAFAVVSCRAVACCF